MIALTSDGRPFIEHRPGMVSRWINSSQLITVPHDSEEGYTPPNTQKRSVLSGVDATVLNMALVSAANEFKLAPWMLKRPSNNKEVQRARGKAAHLLMALRGDDGRCSYELEQIAIALDFYDLDTMIEHSHEFVPDEDKWGDE